MQAPLYLQMLFRFSEIHPDAEGKTSLKLFQNPEGQSSISRWPTDQEIEMGVSRDSKSPGGITDISMNPPRTLLMMTCQTMSRSSGPSVLS